MRASVVNKESTSALAYPAPPVSEMAGKNAARATPIRASAGITFDVGLSLAEEKDVFNGWDQAVMSEFDATVISFTGV